MPVRIITADHFGVYFVDKSFLTSGRDEYTIRFSQNPAEKHRWRPLTFNEVETLIKNGNTCTNWNTFLTPLRRHSLKTRFSLD